MYQYIQMTLSPFTDVVFLYLHLYITYLLLSILTIALGHDSHFTLVFCPGFTFWMAHMELTSQL